MLLLVKKDCKTYHRNWHLIKQVQTTLTYGDSMNCIKSNKIDLKRTVLVPCVVSLVLFLLISVPAYSSSKSTLIGAEKVIAEINKEAEALLQSSVQATDTDPVELLKNELDVFKKNKHTNPELAAAEWFNLLERYWDLSQTEKMGGNSFSGFEGDSLSLLAFIKAIPGPESWLYIEKRIDKYDDSSENSLEANVLRIIICFLNGKQGELSVEIDRLDKIISKLDLSSDDDVKAILEQLRNYVYRSSITNDSASIIAHFRKMIDSKKEQTSAKGVVTIPDLVNIAGQKEAIKLIDQTLSIKNVVVEVPSGGDTLSLVKKVVVEKINVLDTPQWKLINSPDDIELFEVMYEKFGKGDQDKTQSVVVDVFSNTQFPEQVAIDNSAQSEAELYYIFGLVAHDRVNDAVTFTLNHDLSSLSNYDIGNVWSRIDQIRTAPLMLQYCSRVLKDSPDLPFWKLYASLSIALDEIDQYLSALDVLSRDKSLSLKLLQQVEMQRIDMFLAQGDIDKALEVVHRFVQIDIRDISSAVQEDFLEEKSTLGQKIADVGKLLNRQDLIDAGLDIMMSVVEESSHMSVKLDRLLYSVGSSFFIPICDWLIETDQLDKAEKIIVDSLVSKMKKFKGMEFEISVSEYSPYLPDLLLLVQVYNKAGRHDDVLLLLETAPWWGKKYLGDINDTSLSLASAQALLKVGRKDEAINIMQDQIYKHTENDALYNVLVDNSDVDIIPWLDNLYKTDRFEERPLIWKAVILYNNGKFEEAENVIRHALKIDPTDGEQKAGDRVRAYAVLSDILRAVGKVSDADFFSNVVESVRMAEKGDKFNKAGLIEKSLEYYSEAEILFGDAYCVQWRKAERLYEMGKYEEAKKHYEIAFERMPEQFGQVASFCFGCEGVFDKKHSRSIAETVLLRLEKNNPDRPQVYFLLGQLREAQEKYSEAYSYFKKAVELDPDYLDAWKRIVKLHDNIFLTQEELNSITLTMLKLDPLQKHFYADLDKVSNFIELWPVLEEAAKLNDTSMLDDKLLPLTGSKKAMEKGEEKLREIMPERWKMYLAYKNAVNIKQNTPGDILANHFIVSLTGQIVQMVQFSY